MTYRRNHRGDRAGHPRPGILSNQSKTQFHPEVCAPWLRSSARISRLASLALLHDLQRFAPQLYQKIDDLRQRTCLMFRPPDSPPGLAEGRSVSEIDPAFAVEFLAAGHRGPQSIPPCLNSRQLTAPANPGACHPSLLRRASLARRPERFGRHLAFRCENTFPHLIAGALAAGGRRLSTPRTLLRRRLGRHIAFGRLLQPRCSGEWCSLVTSR